MGSGIFASHLYAAVAKFSGVKGSNALSERTWLKSIHPHSMVYCGPIVPHRLGEAVWVEPSLLLCIVKRKRFGIGISLFTFFFI